MSRYRHYFALEKRLQHAGCLIDRSEVVLEITEGRTHSLRELTHPEYTRLIDKMGQVAGRVHDGADNRMRRKVIALFRKMGYENEAGTKADMRAIYTWVKKYGKFHKSLNQHSRAELAGLVTQAELMYQSHLKEVHR